jgi:hypothetical protein
MGLDMYLTKRTYVGNPHKKQENQIAIDTSPQIKIKQSRISHITEDVGYWRKANHIHNWFVQHVQDGNDDCKEYYVSIEDLKELLSTCKTVLKASTLVPGKVTKGWSIEKGKKTPIIENGKIIKDPTTAKELLPSISGFFFGNEEYNETYIEDIKNTIKIITEILKEDNSDSDFYYSSSW